MGKGLATKVSPVITTVSQSIEPGLRIIEVGVIPSTVGVRGGVGLTVGDEDGLGRAVGGNVGVGVSVGGNVGDGVSLGGNVHVGKRVGVGASAGVWVAEATGEPLEQGGHV